MSWNDLALLALTLEVIGIGIGVGISVVLWKTVFDSFPFVVKIVLTILTIIFCLYGFISFIIYINTLVPSSSDLSKQISKLNQYASTRSVFHWIQQKN